MMAVMVMTLWGWIGSQDNSFSGLWLFVCFILSSAFMWMRKRRQKPASNVFSEDTRPPVLYLRSFKDDDITSRPIRESALPFSFTEEEHLVDVLNDFGPCIAIGQPGEKLPALGAARMYVANDQWQDKVGELLISSKLVVLRAGKTQNFLWEVEQSIRSVNPRKIIILIPKMKNIYSQFRNLANKSFPRSLPENIGEANLFSGIASLHGYIHFDDDWTPNFTKFGFQIPFWQRNMAFPTMYVMRNSLAPIYEQFGMLVPKTENMNLIVVMVAFLLSMLCLSILNR
jgi:hypothetical protein